MMLNWGLMRFQGNDRNVEREEENQIGGDLKRYVNDMDKCNPSLHVQSHTPHKNLLRVEKEPKFRLLLKATSVTL